MAKQNKTTTIKQLRAEQNLSQAAFAKAIGVSTASVGAYESGRINPSEKVLDKIKDVFGVMVSDGKATAAKIAAKAEKAVKTSVAKVAAAEFVIQSPMGGEITPEEILARVGKVDRVYVRVDENKAYWVRGEETGSIDLW